MEITKGENKVNFGYKYRGIQLLEWETVQMPKAGTKVKKRKKEKPSWEKYFEIFLDKESDPACFILTLDTTFRLMTSETSHTALIKVRSVFAVSHFEGEKYPDDIIACMMDKSVSYCRALCALKSAEENIKLPVIPVIAFQKLVNISNVMLYKPALYAFTHESMVSDTVIHGAAPRNDVAINVNHRRIVYFVPLPPEHAETIVSGLGENRELQATFGFNYDYEKEKGVFKKVHIDASISIPTIAKILVRTSFGVDLNEADLFTKEILSVMFKEASVNMMQLYKQQCAANKIKFNNEINFTKETVESYAANSISQYYDSRKGDDENNSKLEIPGLHLTIGGNTHLAIKGTFLILDEILFRNPAFNTKHNLEAFTNETQIPYPYYITTKFNCLRIESEPIQLTWKDTILFYLCLDIALQVALSDHTETLQPVFNKLNFIPFRQKEFVKFGNDLFEYINRESKKSGGRIINLENRKNWAEIIR